MLATLVPMVFGVQCTLQSVNDVWRIFNVTPWLSPRRAMRVALLALLVCAAPERLPDVPERLLRASEWAEFETSPRAREGDRRAAPWG